jgi:hypothetical protein
MMALKAAVEERSTRAHLGYGERGRRGGGGVVRRGGVRMPCYRDGGGAGWSDGEENQVAGAGVPLWTIQFGDEGK